MSEWQRDMNAEQMAIDAQDGLCKMFSSEVTEFQRAAAMVTMKDWIDGLVIRLAEPIKQHFYEAGLDVAEDDKERQRDLVQGI